VAELEYLTEQRLNDVIESCRQSGAWAKLVHVIGSVFIDPEALMYSFLSSSCCDNVLLSKKCEEMIVVDEDKDQDNMASLEYFLNMETVSVCVQLINSLLSKNTSLVI